MSEKSDQIQHAADILRGGATMLAETCPVCGTPLFKTGNEITCPKCNKPVVIIRKAEDETKILRTKVLENAERTLLNKISDVQAAIDKENDPESIRKLTGSLTELLNALEKIRRD